MPMIPEAAYAMLACARIGAIHSVVFGGFSPEDLMEGNTRYAQGGIAAVYNFEKDSFKKHIEDTYIAGDSEGDLDVIDFVVKLG